MVSEIFYQTIYFSASGTPWASSPTITLRKQSVSGARRKPSETFSEGKYITFRENGIYHKCVSIYITFREGGIYHFIIYRHDKL